VTTERHDVWSVNTDPGYDDEVKTSVSPQASGRDA